MGVRVIVRTADDGRVGFNQVVMEQQDPPAGVLLVAIEPDEGLYVWLRSHNALAPHTIPQAKGYSRALLPFDIGHAPSFLGEAVFISRDEIDGWDEIVGGQTNTLNREIRKLFGIAG